MWGLGEKHNTVSREGCERLLSTGEQMYSGKPSWLSEPTWVCRCASSHRSAIQVCGPTRCAGTSGLLYAEDKRFL